MGYVVEVDLEYPEHLHDAYNDYLLAPETLTVPEIWLCELCYRNLKRCKSLKITKITKIHRAVLFKQLA